MASDGYSMPARVGLETVRSRMASPVRRRESIAAASRFAARFQLVRRENTPRPYQQGSAATSAPAKSGKSGKAVRAGRARGIGRAAGRDQGRGTEHAASRDQRRGYGTR